MPENEAFDHRARVRLTHHQEVSGSPEEVFPLLCPVRELEWVPGWDCEVIHTDSGVAEEGCVFRTREEDGRPDTWVVSRYEPCRRIQFVRVHPRRAIRYDIRLETRDGGGTRLRWEQEITALDEEGDRIVRASSSEEFAAGIERLEAQLEHYLRTGRALEVAG